MASDNELGIFFSLDYLSSPQKTSLPSDPLVKVHQNADNKNQAHMQGPGVSKLVPSFFDQRFQGGPMFPRGSNPR